MPEPPGIQLLVSRTHYLPHNPERIKQCLMSQIHLDGWKRKLGKWNKSVVFFSNLFQINFHKHLLVHPFSANYSANASNRYQWLKHGMLWPVYWTISPPVVAAYQILNGCDARGSFREASASDLPTSALRSKPLTLNRQCTLWIKSVAANRTHCSIRSTSVLGRPVCLKRRRWSTHRSDSNRYDKLKWFMRRAAKSSGFYIYAERTTLLLCALLIFY